MENYYFMEGIVLITAAFWVDYLVGDPPFMLHPVVMMGRLIAWLEEKLYPGAESLRLVLGGVTVLLTLGAVGLVFYALNWFLAPWPWLWWPLNIWFGAASLAGHGLARAALKVWSPLSQGNIKEARLALAEIVGRDCQELPGPEVVRGTIETVAENTSDGLIAPLFYLALGGVPLAMIYKAINTMDSMLGYKNPRYLYFGRVAARLDDAANWFPARVTGFLLIAAAGLCRRNWRHSLSTMLRFHGSHPSPNSGWPEAAVSGALEVTLGGTNYYGGVASNRPLLVGGRSPLEADHIIATVALMRISGWLALMLLAIIRGIALWL